MYSGRLTNSATVSAVSVLPTPGGPWSTQTRPMPLPLTMSSKLSRFWACVDTSACTVFLMPASSTRSSKQLVFHSISARSSTKNSMNRFPVNEYPRTVALVSMALSSDSLSNLRSPSAAANVRWPWARLRLRSILDESSLRLLTLNMSLGSSRWYVLQSIMTRPLTVKRA